MLYLQENICIILPHLLSLIVLKDRPQNVSSVAGSSPWGVLVDQVFCSTFITGSSYFRPNRPSRSPKVLWTFTNTHLLLWVYIWQCQNVADSIIQPLFQDCIMTMPIQSKRWIGIVIIFTVNEVWKVCAEGCPRGGICEGWNAITVLACQCLGTQLTWGVACIG